MSETCLLCKKEMSEIRREREEGRLYIYYACPNGHKAIDSPMVTPEEQEMLDAILGGGGWYI